MSSRTCGVRVWKGAQFRKGHAQTVAPVLPRSRQKSEIPKRRDAGRRKDCSVTAQALPETLALPRLKRREGLAAARRTIRDVRPFAIFSMLVVIAFFLSISSRLSLDSIAFELEELETSIDAEQVRHFDLQLELARLQAPDRILDRALGLGMVYPSDRAVVGIQLSAALVEGDEYRWAELKAFLSDQP